MPVRYEIEPLGEQHNRAAFSSGVEPLDRYLRERAGQEMRRNVAVVYVLRLLGESEIAGYYSLSATSIEPTGLPQDILKRLPRYPTLPALLIGRLAVDQRYRGQGIGQALLMSGLARSWELHDQIGAIGVIVDAKDDSARAFYEHYRFQGLLDQPYRLFLLMRTIEELVSGTG
jgi:GNAT superfamily N-acetyltransferase